MTSTCTMPIDVAENDSASAHSDPSALIEALRWQDRTACEGFVREFGPRMLAVARRFMRCEHDAADALQDAFVSAFKSISSFHGQSSLGTWLHRIVVNACLMKLRSQKSQKEVSIDELLPSFDSQGKHSPDVRSWRKDIEDPLEISETRAKVRSSIDLLPPAYRSVILLRDIEQHDTEQTARLLDCSVANVKVRLHRARQALKSLLDPDFSEPPSPASANPFYK